MTTTVGGKTVPNWQKVHEIPALGGLTSFTADVLSETYDLSAGMAFKHFAKLTDEQLEEKFNEIDDDKSGKLERKEIAKALRSIGMKEKDIKKQLDSMQKPEL